MAELEAAFEAGLELVARDGDPTDAVYARLFERFPQIEPLFVGDRSGQARGQMLAMALETLGDLVAGRTWAANMIRAERVNHDQLGVPDEIFSDFFSVVLEVFRERAGPAWTPDIDAAWRAAVALADVR